ncbi:MAG TPA: hypothetical protein VFV85_04215, partial [Conexibacter sp.]|nr:hypothetical protein [Conexibacter sp.]
MVAWRTGSLLAAVLALAAGSAADARRHAPPTDVGVGAREYHLSAYRSSAPHGVVRFDLVNYGEDGHDLVVQTRGGRDIARTGTV